MKRIVAALLLLYVSISSAQNSISGTVVDQNQEPLPFTNVLLLNAEDPRLITGAISDEMGRFILETTQNGTFFLRITSIGFSDYDSPIYELDGRTEIRIEEPIQLAEDVQQLDEVELVGRRNLYERQPDRTVVNVQSSSINAGGSALSVIETSPGMTVNRVNGVIGMLGKEGTAVYINGKRTRMSGGALVQLLDGLPASNIEKLELINNPPASFDAEGTAGVINIILKQDNLNQGWSGTVVANTGYGDDIKYGASADVFYSGKKLSFFTSISNNNDYNEQPTFIDRAYTLDGNRFREDLNSARDAFTGLTQLRLGGEYEFSEKTALGGEFKIRKNAWDLDAFSETVGTENGNRLFTEDLRSTEINDWTHVLTSIFLDQKIGENSTLGFEYDYLGYDNENDATYDEVRTENEVVSNRSFISEAETDVEFHVAKADFNTSLDESTTLGFGVKATISSFTNDVSVFDFSSGEPIMDETLSQIRNLDEDIWAAYVDLNFKLGEKTDVNAGLRYEYTDSNLSTVGEENDIVLNRGQFFPSLRVSHRLNENWNTSFSYGERITRPNFNTLSPAFFFFNSTTIVTGNPAIRPVTARSFSYSLGHKRKQLTFQFTDERSPNAWGTPSFSEDFSTTTLIPQPIEDRKLFSATLSFPVKLLPKLTSNHSISGLWQHEVPIYEGISLTRNNWYINVNSNFQYQLSSKLTADFSANYISPRILGLSGSDAAIGLNLGASYRFSDRWQLSFSFRDILDRNSFLQFDSDIPENDANLDWIYQSEGNIGSLSLRYNFGTGSKRKERGYGSEDEQKRVN
ncbi:outer membrane beta-barrel family protein [Flagellimonas meridianipacifica]|uniref:Outer membrane receptor protein involved in Fe transport n=1 Tax=Flagellimonas meridianipacifica TaxID=1080225 RepID=A0A2T0MBJ9_9FLAO|nr:outer membrane beta-barrel family protein [Allomuricauda pacifica]PRX54878.1 outer membrane receptor protein involved in Fe transport [Allomuricauda pacifica]